MQICLFPRVSPWLPLGTPKMQLHVALDRDPDIGSVCREIL